MRLIKSRAPGKIRVKADRSISLSLPLVLVHPRRYHALSFPSALRCPSFLSLSLSLYLCVQLGYERKKKKNKERKKEKEAVFRLRGERKKISSETGWRDGRRRTTLFSRHRGARLLHPRRCSFLPMTVSPPFLLPPPPRAPDDEGNSVVTISHWFGIRRAILTTRAYIRFVKRTITEFGPVILCIRLAMPV